VLSLAAILEIGLEATRVLSNAGATIVIGARDLTKAREAVSQIKKVEVSETGGLAKPAAQIQKSQ